MLREYPDSLPLEALTLLRDKIKGNDVSAAKLTNAAWNVVGYGLSIGLPVKDLASPIGSGLVYGIDEDVAGLDELIAGAESGGANFPIALVVLAVKIALKILL